MAVMTTDEKLEKLWSVIAYQGQAISGLLLLLSENNPYGEDDPQFLALVSGLAGVGITLSYGLEDMQELKSELGR